MAEKTRGYASAQHPATALETFQLQSVVPTPSIFGPKRNAYGQRGLLATHPRLHMATFAAPGLPSPMHSS